MRRPRRHRLVYLAAWTCTALALLFSLAAVLSNRYWFAWSGENFRREAFSSRGIVFFRANLRRLPPGVVVLPADGPGPGWHHGPYVDNGNYFNSHPTEPWQWRPSASLSSSHATLDLPLWIPILLSTLAALPLWWPAVRAGRRVGYCPFCAYDRRGIPPSAPCPECGFSPGSPV